MLLEDYRDAVAFCAGGIPKPDQWVDELVHARNRASFEGLG